ncbi:NADPH-dependent FMN reductase [Streptomyces tendae]|uniref:NADPH-dependent FMN reductase n=1 Tax=Streptomyces tendae TaxID=1932 RepID=UPI00378C5664
MSDSTPPVLQVIVASTRPGRAGLPVGQWVVELAKKHGAFEVELVDLKEVDLPLLDEPNHLILRQYTHEHTKRWSETVARGDAFVIVMPEYNHSFNAALKNAIDHLVLEWTHKPVGLVSYGGVSGGTRAVHALKPTLSALKMVPLTEGVIIPFVGTFLSDEGEGRVFRPNAEIEDGASAMFEELTRTAAALAPLRG